MTKGLLMAQGSRAMGHSHAPWIEGAPGLGQVGCEAPIGVYVDVS
jgi:hypothetical protein